LKYFIFALWPSNPFPDFVVDVDPHRVTREKDEEEAEKPSDEEGDGGESTDFYSAPSRVVMLTDQEAGSDPESDPVSSVPAENLEMPDDDAPGLVSHTYFSLHLQIVKVPSLKMSFLFLGSHRHYFSCPPPAPSERVRSHSKSGKLSFDPFRELHLSSRSEDGSYSLVLLL